MLLGILLTFFIAMPFLILGLVIWLTMRENTQAKDSKSYGVRIDRLFISIAAYSLSLGGILGGTIFISIGFGSNDFADIFVKLITLTAFISNLLMAIAWIYNVKIYKPICHIFIISSVGYLISHFPLFSKNYLEALMAYFMFVILSVSSILVLGYYLTFISLKKYHKNAVADFVVV